MCSASKAELVSSLGAQHVLDYRKDHIDGTFDLIIDCGGHSPIARLRSLTQPGGTVVLVGSEEGALSSAWADRSARPCCRPS